MSAFSFLSLHLSGTAALFVTPEMIGYNYSPPPVSNSSLFNLARPLQVALFRIHESRIDIFRAAPAAKVNDHRIPRRPDNNVLPLDVGPD